MVNLDLEATPPFGLIIENADVICLSRRCMSNVCVWTCRIPVLASYYHTRLCSHVTLQRVFAFNFSLINLKDIQGWNAVEIVNSLRPPDSSGAVIDAELKCRWLIKEPWNPSNEPSLDDRFNWMDIRFDLMFSEPKRFFKAAQMNRMTYKPPRKTQTSYQRDSHIQSGLMKC